MGSMTDLVQALGGSGSVAKALGLKQNTVAMWRLRKRIPWRYRPALADLAEQQGVAVPRDFLKHDAEAA